VRGKQRGKITLVVVVGSIIRVVSVRV
jgi:hypothetical protein